MRIKNDIIVKWNKDNNGVEIKGNDEHFIIDINPSYHINYYNAINHCNINQCCLPSTKQLQLVYKIKDRINKIIHDNSGVQLKGWFWCCEEKWKLFAYNVNIDSLCIQFNPKELCLNAFFIKIIN